jgi:hypothetical protein
MTFEDMGTSLAVECATEREVFETYVERVLVPTLGCGQQGVVMGNLTTCKGEGQTDERGARLPARLHAGLLCGSQPYRGAFSKIKGLVRKNQARTPREALVEAVGRALSAVTSREARGFFKRCG